MVQNNKDKIVKILFEHINIAIVYPIVMIIANLISDSRKYINKELLFRDIGVALVIFIISSLFIISWNYISYKTKK